MGDQCFLCDKKLGRFAMKWQKINYEKINEPIPSGMTEQDKVCQECFSPVQLKSYNEKKQQKEESKMINDPVAAEQKQIMDDIRVRVPEFKTRWNKGGVIQYKDDYVAILHRAWGAQVEFIVAYSDLTKEGYRLMAQDEGKSGSSGGLTGGVDSYYYFQKIEFVTLNTSL